MAFHMSSSSSGRSVVHATSLVALITSAESNYEALPIGDPPSVEEHD